MVRRRIFFASFFLLAGLGLPGAGLGPFARAAEKGSGKASAQQAPAAPEAPKAGNAEKTEKTKAPDTYTVVQVGPDEVKVIQTSELAALKKKLSEEYRAKLKAHEAAKKAARKAGKKLEDPKPQLERVKVVATYLKTPEQAKAVQEKAFRKIEEAKAKARAKAEKSRSRS